MRDFLNLRRVIMIGIAIGLVGWCAYALQWDWLANPKYQSMMLRGLWQTIWMLVVTMVVGFALAIPIGFVQAAGPRWLAWPARVFCSVIRGTPLLMQIWLLYYGIGALFPSIPWIRDSAMWPILRQAWPYAVIALSLSVAGYEGEVLRGAFKSVPHGQLEAAKAMGMPRFTMFRRIWLPQAIQRVLPTIGGETVLQLKSTPLISTITIMEIYDVAGRVRRDTLVVYEPLLLLALTYMIITALIVLLFKWFESRFPSKVA
ncbi:ABC transporter permease [Cypionkella sinensis]|uniref:ABC transporter permease n=1 Tax=Cypionkella sinensis TaxID=1756043 RepID=A0ABV7IV42_9RHOB